MCFPQAAQGEDFAVLTASSRITLGEGASETYLDLFPFLVPLDGGWLSAAGTAYFGATVLSQLAGLPANPPVIQEALEKLSPYDSPPFGKSGRLGIWRYPHALSRPPDEMWVGRVFGIGRLEGRRWARIWRKDGQEETEMARSAWGCIFPKLDGGADRSPLEREVQRINNGFAGGSMWDTVRGLSASHAAVSRVAGSVGPDVGIAVVTASSLCYGHGNAAELAHATDEELFRRLRHPPDLDRMTEKMAWARSWSLEWWGFPDAGVTDLPPPFAMNLE